MNMRKRSPVPRGSVDSRTLQKIEDTTVISFTGEDLRQVGTQNLNEKKQKKEKTLMDSNSRTASRQGEIELEGQSC